MEIIKTQVKDLLLIKPKVYKDNRGFFMESYSEKAFSELGITTRFVQDNHSLSAQKGVVRGLHFQLPPYGQAKLIRVTHGAVFDVAVDLRKQSPTYGTWKGYTLTAENFHILYIPRGFAHGYCTLEDDTEFMYKCDNLYMPEYDTGLRWNDPTLNIKWPIENPILSEKDATAPFYQDFESPF